jgi:hypothetical protein
MISLMTEKITLALILSTSVISIFISIVFRIK